MTSGASPASTPQRTPLPGCSRRPGPTGPPPTPPRPGCCSTPARGRTCTRRSRSGTRSGSATPRSRSPDPVRPWSRSSVWPSSRPRSGCPPRPARPTSVRPSSCGTGSRAPGPGSGPGTCRRGGPGGSPAPRSPSLRGGGVRGRPGRGVRAPDPPLRGGPAGRGGDRAVHARRGPPPPGGRRGRPARPRAHRTRCPSRAPCGWRPRSTWPTPWTWTPPSRPVPPGSPTSARPPRWTCAAPKPSAQMARHQLSLDLDTTTDAATHTGPDTGPEVVLHVHLSEDAITAPDSAAPGPGGEHPLASSTPTRSAPGAAPRHQVTVKPVLDLAEHLHVDQYQVPDRLADQAAERDLTCVFPWCTRPAEACDPDHVIPYSEGGPTASDNLAPLCRRHHRLKTHHSGWGYTVLEPGSLPVALPARLPVPARPHRHHRRHPRPDLAPARPVATPPHTPRPHSRRGATGMSRSDRTARTTFPHPSLRARESVAAGRCGRGAAGRERKGWRGGDTGPTPAAAAADTPSPSDRR